MLLAMRDVLLGDKEYPFLGDNAKERLSLVRRVAQNAHLERNTVVHLGGQSYCFLPWLGTRSFRTMKRLLSKYSKELGISDIESEGCYYITFKAKNEAGMMLNDAITNILVRDGLDTDSLVRDGECPVFDKFDEFIPPELLREAFAKDRLRSDEILERYL